MFEAEKSSLGELCDDEFEQMILALRDDSWDEIFENRYWDDPDTPGREPPVWLLNWTKSLRIRGLFTVELEPIYESWGIVGDDRLPECWIFDSGLDLPGLRVFRIAKPLAAITPDDIWPTVRDHFEETVLNLIFGEFHIDTPELFPRKELVKLLQKHMQEEGESLMGEAQLTLLQWEEVNFGK
jgi:hypothetical protein